MTAARRTLECDIHGVPRPSPDMIANIMDGLRMSIADAEIIAADFPQPITIRLMPGAAQSLLDYLAIAQGQRGELERLRSNASTAAFDKVNDQLREANRENEELRGLLGNAGQADIERQYCNCNP